MPSPFPGMDPYLERPAKWPNVHQWIVFGLAEALGQVLPDHYYVSIEERLSIADLPDRGATKRPDATVIDTGGPPPAGAGVALLERGVAVLVPQPETLRESYLQVVDLRAGEEAVTILELLSPSNKRRGAGREKYLEKRSLVFSQPLNLVEIDLLRAGERMPVEGVPHDYAYSLLLCRAAELPRAVLLPFGVREPIPRFPLPLRTGEEEPWVDLGAVFGSVYDRGRFARFAAYATPPEPPLLDDDAAWAERLLTPYLASEPH
ncbi:MAG TPA: DUF4058 family protein [Armatimonadota bacterium]|nr:DUF4058 family protein [Armatimonadota bacterium]